MLCRTAGNNEAGAIGQNFSHDLPRQVDHRCRTALRAQVEHLQASRTRLLPTSHQPPIVGTDLQDGCSARNLESACLAAARDLYPHNLRAADERVGIPRVCRHRLHLTPHG